MPIAARIEEVRHELVSAAQASAPAKALMEMVCRLLHDRMLKAAEYKRRQATPGVKITKLAFGRDYRYPITNGFNDA